MARLLSDADARDRQRTAGQLRAQGRNWKEIAAAVGLRTERAAIDVVRAAVRHGLVNEADLPESMDSWRPLKKIAAPAPVLDYTAPVRDPYWRDNAVCRDEGIDPEMFQPLSDNWVVGDNPRRAEEAKAVCRRCPVSGDCLIDAFASDDQWAVRGATTPEERRAMRRNGAAA